MILCTVVLCSQVSVKVKCDVSDVGTVQRQNVFLKRFTQHLTHTDHTHRGNCIVCACFVCMVAH